MAVSATAGIVSDFFIALVPRLVPCTTDSLDNGWKLFGILLRAQIEPQFVAWPLPLSIF